MVFPLFLSLLLLFTPPCLGASNLDASLSVNFSSHVGTTHHYMFGTVDSNPVLLINNGTEAYMKNMASMEIEFVRIVETSAVSWADNANKVWNVQAIQNYFSILKSQYAAHGTRFPEFMITLKQWPAWMSTAPQLPDSLLGNYSQWCADLVKIINVDMGLNVTYWQPWNNLDTGYIQANNLEGLYRLHAAAAQAMKGVDPSIKIGASFSQMTSPYIGYNLDLLRSTPYVDFLELHFYLTPNLYARTTEQIFLEGQISQKYHDYVDPILAEFPNLEVIMDEYALHYNNTGIDVRVTNNIAATWFATMHMFFAKEGIRALNYNIRSNYIGLMDQTNTPRPSGSIFAWSNRYFVGDRCSSESDYGKLQVMAVSNEGVYAIYVINTYANETVFRFSSLTGIVSKTGAPLDSSQLVFVKNTVNASGVLENEVTWEWVGVAGSHTIPGYSVWVLYYNDSNPALPPPTPAPTLAPTPAPEPLLPRKYNRALSAGLGAFVGVGCLVGIFAAVLLGVYWASFTKKYGTFYCGVIISGVLIAYAAALTLLPRPTDALCVAFPWLVGVGFTLVYGCLFIKTWILYRIWMHAMQLKRMSINAFTVVKYVGVALTIEIIFMIIWTVIDPPKVHMIKMIDDTLQAQCHSDTPIFWIIFICIKGIWLLFGAIITILTRDVIREYNDFSSTAYAIYNNVILIVIAIPLAIVLKEVPHGTLIIEVIVIVLTFTFTMVILFFDTWSRILFPKSQMPEGVLDAHSRATNSAMSHVGASRAGSGNSHSSVAHSNSASSHSAQDEIPRSKASTGDSSTSDI